MFQNSSFDVFSQYYCYFVGHSLGKLIFGPDSIFCHISNDQQCSVTVPEAQYRRKEHRVNHTWVSRGALDNELCTRSHSEWQCSVAGRIRHARNPIAQYRMRTVSWWAKGGFSHPVGTACPSARAKDATVTQPYTHTNEDRTRKQSHARYIAHVYVRLGAASEAEKRLRSAQARTKSTGRLCQGKANRPLRIPRDRISPFPPATVSPSHPFAVSLSSNHELRKDLGGTASGHPTAQHMWAAAMSHVG